MSGTMKRFAVLVVLLGTLAGGSATQAGRQAGPASSVDRVQAFDTDVYELRFVGGYPARVVVDGDNDTDLDVYVYDEFGNLVAFDDDYTDYCIASWTPAWTQTFRVEIRNRGDVYNRYEIRTN